MKYIKIKLYFCMIFVHNRLEKNKKLCYNHNNADSA